MFRAVSDDDIEAYSDTCNVFHQEVYRWCSTDKNNPHLPHPKTCGLKAMFDQPCQHGHLPLNQQLNTNNARSMWQGIDNITGFKGNKPATVNIAASLPDELNNFYVRFEAHNTTHTESAPAAAAEEVSPLSISVAAVTRSFKQGEYPQSCGSGWHPRPCAQSMRIPTSWGFYRHFQSLPLTVCGSLMLQKIHHCAHTK